MTADSPAPPSLPRSVRGSLPAAPPRRPWFQAPWLLWAVLLLAAGFRFYGIRWDENTGSHPDERHVLMAAHKLGWPESVGEYFDAARSPLNPRNRGTSYFAYGTLPTTLLTAAVEAFNVRKPEDQAILGRVLSASADLGVVLAVFALAGTLYRDRRVALLGAGLYAAAVLPIQHAHFFVVDPFGNLFATLALLALALATTTTRSAEDSGRAPRSPTFWSILAGVALGLAAACKISLLVLLAPAGVALLLKAGLGSVAAGGRQRARALFGAAARGVALLVTCALTFRAVEPDAFVGWIGLEPRWLENMQYVTGISRGIIDVPFTLQWAGRTRLVYPAVNLLTWGLGPALGLAGVFACAWAGARLVVPRQRRQREWAHLLPLLWVGVTFLAFGTQWQMTMRYFLPLYAPLATLAAWALREAGCWKAAAEVPAESHAPPPSILRYRLRWVFTGAVPVATLLWAIAYLHIYSQPFTRAEASRWIYAHIPAGTALGAEHWDDTLPLSLPGTPGQESYRIIDLPWYEAENEEKRQLVATRLDEAEYLVLASDKLYGSIPRTPWRYPMAGEYYRALFDGRLGFDLVAEFRGRMNLLGWKFPTDAAEEAFSVYDHPRVMIFKKSPRYSAAAARALFADIDLSHTVFSNRPPSAGSQGGAEAAVGQQASVKTERDILLTDARWQEQQSAGSWRALFNRDSFANRHPVLAWTAMLLALLAVGFPYAFVVMRALPDRGLGLCRLFMLALPSWAVWLLASYERVRFSAANWWTALALLGVGSAAIVYRRRATLRAFLRAEWSRLLAGELVFWAAFGLCLTIRAYNPDVWHPAWGGEKPMEMTYLHGVMKSDYFPPYNPWYAGGFINYYYFGFVLTGALIKAVGVLPSVGFNLCLATFFGFAAAAAFSVARAMTERAAAKGRRQVAGAHPPRIAALWPAFAGAAFVVLFGNLFQGKFLVERLVQLGQADHALTVPVVSDLIRAARGIEHVRDGSAPLTVYPGDLYWCAARAIPVSEPNAVPPVTEFPFWSFLYADLHPHVIALPFTIALLGVLLAWLRGERGERQMPDAGSWMMKEVSQPTSRLPHPASPPRRIFLLLAMSFLLGLFWPTNTWDWPTYGALTGLVLFLGGWSRPCRATPRAFFITLGKALALFLPTLVLGRLAFRPFFQHVVSGYGAFELWRGERTTLSAYCIVHGFFLFVIVSAFCVGLRDRGASGPVRALQSWLRLLREYLPGAGSRAFRDALSARFRQRPLAAVAALVGTCAIYALALAVLMRASLPAALALGVVLAAVLAVEKRREPLRAFAFLLVALGFGLSLAVEFVVLAGDVGRMNTVFKFYYQVWVMFALASAALLPTVLRARRSWSLPARRAWTGGFGALCLLALAFPVTGTPAKIADKLDREQRPTLDGLAFLESPAARCRVLDQDVDLRPDGLAIRWLQDHVTGSPVLLEMNTGKLLYSWGSRFSIHTGLPSVVGWDWHQRQQQAGLEKSKVPERIADVLTIYSTPDPEVARPLLEKYGVSLIVVGALERIYGTPEGLEKFSTMAGIESIYARDGVTIYRVLAAPAHPPVLAARP